MPSHRWRALLLPVAAAVALSGCWLQPGFDPHHSGHNPGEQRLTVANVATLDEAWSVTVGPDPVLAPVVSRYGVHVTSRRILATYRLADGNRSWSVDVNEGLDPDADALAGPPVVWRDRLLVPVGFHHPHIIPPTVSYDAATGVAGDRVADYASNTLDGSTLVGRSNTRIGDFDEGVLHSTDLEDPSKNWSILYLSNANGPALTDRWIVTSHPAGRVDAFPRSGPTPERCQTVDQWTICSPAWTRETATLTTAPAISDDGLTVFVGDATGTLSAVDIENGAVRWTGSVGAGAQILAAPTVGDGTVFVTTSDGRVAAFDADGCGAATCAPRWSTAATGSPVRVQSALAGGVVYAGSDDGAIRAFDASGCGATVCAPSWETSVGSAITGAPAVTRGRLVVGTADGRLIAFRPTG